MDICCEANESCTDNNLCEACRSFDLNGMWEDNGREIQIIHEGHHVTATYVEPHTCDHRNGSGTSQTTLDFTADIRCNTLIGEMNVCHWGDRPNPGFRLTPLRLTASPEGKSVFAAINRLMGEWKNEEGSGLLSIRRLE
jgi:hypothetical protein